MSAAYDEAVAATWRVCRREPSTPDLARELIRVACLAPSSHNTQCWRFVAGRDRVMILPDFDRRCPVVDPDDHHLWVSLGCAAETLVHAARAHGRAATVGWCDAPAGVVIELAPAPPLVSDLFSAIGERQCTRGLFDGRPIDRAELDLLAEAGRGRGVDTTLVTDATRSERLLELIVTASGVQMSDRAFMRELEHWLRFNDREALATRDGLFARTTGNPTLPRWLARPLLPLVLTARGEADRIVRQVRSASGIAVLSSAGDGPMQWVEVGRCCQRFALRATALGIRTAFLNQPVEVAALRPQLAVELALGPRRPDLLVRFGRGPTMPRSLRRPVEDVLVDACAAPADRAQAPASPRQPPPQMR